jgi:hypothetical protein
MENIFSKKNLQASAFIMKLFDILEVEVTIRKKQTNFNLIYQNSNIYSHIVEWSENGQSFIVKSESLMEKEILTVFFSHKNFGSF